MKDSAKFIPLGWGKERRGSASKIARNVPTSISGRNVSTARRASGGPSILDSPKIIGATPGMIFHSCLLRHVFETAKADAN